MKRILVVFLLTACCLTAMSDGITIDERVPFIGNPTKVSGTVISSDPVKVLRVRVEGTGVTLKIDSQSENKIEFTLSFSEPAVADISATYTYPDNFLVLAQLVLPLK